MSARTRKLCALHLVANATLLWLGYEWLDVGESTRLRLVFSAMDALVILALACWLHGATLVYFRTAPESKISEAFRTALGNLAPLVVAAIFVLVIYYLVAWAANAAGQPAFQLASWLSLHLRKPVKPVTVARIFQAVFWVVRWVALPVAILPVASGIAARGWGGFVHLPGGDRPDALASEGAISGWRYWLAVPVLLAAGLQLPFVLLRWVPRFDAFAMQFASFTLRMLVAYLLFVASALTLAFATSRGRPVFSHRKTVAAP